MKRVVAVDGGRGRVAGARLTVTPSRADADACLLPPPPLPSASRAPLLHRGRKLATELATQTPAGVSTGSIASGHDVVGLRSQNQLRIVSRECETAAAAALRVACTHFKINGDSYIYIYYSILQTTATVVVQYRLLRWQRIVAPRAGAIPRAVPVGL